MNSSHQNPALPTWSFVAPNVAALGTALAITTWAPRPLSPTIVFLIVGCVAIGAVVGLVPWLLHYERQKNEVLDERQRELEALARAVNASAEQLSIATRGLHEIVELAQKNLKLADHLPHKLQDKIAEFQAQLSSAEDEEKEELERELLALRTSESERLESVSQRIAKSTAEWAKLETATQQHLTTANEAIAKLAFGTAGAIGKAQAAAEQALSHARIESARVIGDAGGQATREIANARNAALAEFDAKLAAAANTLVDRIAAGLNARADDTSRSISTPSAAEKASPAGSESPSAPKPSDNSTELSPPAGESGSSASIEPPARRLRKMRREEPLAPAAPVGVATDPDPIDPPPIPRPADKPVPPPAPLDEPPPIPARQIPEITPVAPSTAEPFSGYIATRPNGIAPHGDAPRTTAPADGAESPRAARKKAPKKSDHDEPGLGLEIDDTVPGFGSGDSERVLSSDGATRLLVTAYIGIGNRLFIRGQGPGLSWERGVPLQFVSIGKWRWETNDASAPVEFKLYKNDDLECAALGPQSLDAGYQQEVTAAF